MKEFLLEYKIWNKNAELNFGLAQFFVCDIFVGWVWAHLHSGANSIK